MRTLEEVKKDSKNYKPSKTVVTIQGGCFLSEISCGKAEGCGRNGEPHHQHRFQGEGE